MGTRTLEKKASKSAVESENGHVLGDVVSKRSWQISVALLAAAIIAIYWRTFGWWWQQWEVPESHYSHGILIPFIVGFLVWFMRKRLAKMRVEPNMWGLALVLPFGLLQFTTSVGAVYSVCGVTFPLVLTGFLLFLFGKQITKELTFPLLFLYFMIVPPLVFLNTVSFAIQMASTKIATLGLNLLGTHAVRQGTQIQLDDITVLVGAPCSGFRMLIALVAFTSFFAYMKSGPLWGRLSLVGLVFPVSLVANSARILMIALVGQYYGEETMKKFHDWSGYIVLVLTFAVLILIAKVVKCRDFKSMPA